MGYRKDVRMELKEARSVLEALQRDLKAEMRYDEQQSLLYSIVWKQRIQAIDVVLKATEKLANE